MTRHSYRERDYTFGQTMLTLRTSIGLTQASLADLLGVSRRAVGEWEAGSTYPQAEHFQHFLELCVQQHVFTPEREEEEIRALWKTAHQRVLLDEAWLSTLLARPTAAPAPVEEAGATAAVRASPAPVQLSPAAEMPLAQVGGETAVSPRIDWVGALDVSRFTGREGELAELSHWMVHEQCRLIALLGMGGIGKSALISLLGKQLAPQFEAVLWRSLRDAPPCEDLVADCLTFFSETPPTEFHTLLEQRINQLIGRLHERRCLLVLDNLEALLEEGDPEGNYRPGYQGYGRLIERLGESAHQSCVVLTSREKPREIEALEGLRGPVRSLRLLGLSQGAARTLLADKDLRGASSAWLQLIASYAGNPLALKIVGQAIVDLFFGDIVPFLHSGELIFNGIRVVLRQQVARLTLLEQMLLTWLAVLREWTSLDTLLSLLVPRPTRARVLEALEALWRRSLIERGAGASFTLQSVVMEYVTDALLDQLSGEIVTQALDHLRRYALEQAQAKDYVRETQVRVLVRPLVERLRTEFASDTRIEDQLLRLLAHFRAEDGSSQGYGPANVISLLKALRSDLRGLDLSRLTIRGAYLQGVEMQDASLAGATLRDSVFTESFDAIWAVATSPIGQDWATGSKRGEVRVWRVEQEAGQILRLAWQAHTDIVMSLAFSPDGRTLASGSLDGSVKLWEVESGAPLWTVWHVNSVISLAVTSDGRTLASAGNETTVRLWDTTLGTALEDLPHPGPVFALAWSPDGRLLASGGFDGSIRVWQRQQTGPARCVQTLAEHTNWVRGLAFAPDGSVLASASWDGSVKLWDTESGHCLETLTRHTERVFCVAWSPDGRTLASGGSDPTIWLWDAESRAAWAALQGHSATVNSLTFTPDSRSLLSGGDDGTLRVWEVEHGEALRVMEGYAAALYDVAWSPGGTQLASAGSDTLVSLWEVGRGGVMPPTVLHGHRWIVYGVEWRPDGSLLASSGWDNAIRLWDPATGNCLQILEDPDNPDTLFWGVVWSPDGGLLASGTYHQGVLVWDVKAHSLQWADRAHSTWIRRVAWNPDGTRLVGGDEDGHVYVWDARSGTLLQRLPGQHGAVMSVAWSPDGSRLAASSGLNDSGELVVWDARSWARVRDLVEHPGVVTAVAWGRSGELVISGGSDGMVRWWEVESGKCVRVQQAHQGTVQALKLSPNGSMLASCGEDGVITLWDLESGEPLQTLRRDRPYERLTITGIRGLTEAQKASLRALGAFEETRVGR
jgi:WD40 repeat protein/transcriptional regulator with XRE-family HTH domain